MPSGSVPRAVASVLHAGPRSPPPAVLIRKRISVPRTDKIKKGQFDTSEITDRGAMILQVWEAVLAA